VTSHSDMGPTDLERVFGDGQLRVEQLAQLREQALLAKAPFVAFLRATDAGGGERVGSATDEPRTAPY